jgi:hypothetical protein
MIRARTSQGDRAACVSFLAARSITESTSIGARGEEREHVSRRSTRERSGVTGRAGLAFGRHGGPCATVSALNPALPFLRASRAAPGDIPFHPRMSQAIGCSVDRADR